VALAMTLLVNPARGARAAAVDEFSVPPALAPAVRFWVDVFTRYTGDQAVIHDRRQPWIVYDVVPDRPADVAAGVRLLEDRLLLASLVEQAVGVPDPGGPRVHVQIGLREAFAQALAAERLYRPTVERALRRAGLPLALAALPLVESSYHPQAVSDAGAVGLWQLTRATARRFITVSGATDERTDPARASEAAAGHLRELRDALPNWPLALTAYNHGLSGVQRARALLASDDVAVLVSNYRGPSFGFASRNFYAQFAAALHVMRHVERYFPDLAPGRMVEYRVKRGDTLYRVARRHGVSLATLRVTNGLRSAALQPGQRILIDPRPCLGSGAGVWRPVGEANVVPRPAKPARQCLPDRSARARVA
jgi:membrane-bound lytic murein transglycosylase D